MKQVKTLSFASVIIVLLLFGLSFSRDGARAVAPQEPAPGELRLTPHSNGFAGDYRFGNQKFAIESYHPSPDFALTRISKRSGITLIEILRNSNTVTLTLAETTVSFDFGDPSSFTDEEQLALQTALDSVDARIARKIVAASIVQLKSQGVERRLLVGLGAASIVLGSDARSAGPNAETSTLTAIVVPEECAANDCLGCCGSGCIGCIGCCTDACRRHDECVRQFGQFRCLIFLPAAIASVFLECSLF
jgi:hypothetical protein